MKFCRLPKIAAVIAGVALAAVLPSWAAAASIGPIIAQAEKPGGEGTLNAIDAAKRKLNITHGPIAALNWPGMTMDFTVAPGVDIGALKPRGKVKFTLGRGADGAFVIDEINPVR
jgi:Cu/Ag efflux protein CusF